MRSKRTLLFWAACLLFAGSASAQYGPGSVGLYWDGTTSQAGDFCWGHSCTPIPVRVARGETVRIQIRGEWMHPYLLAYSFSANQCFTIPALLNQLVIDPPIAIAVSGTLDQPSPILACPSGLAFVGLTVPMSAPLGASVVFQALAGSFGLQGPQLAFTSALAVTVSS